MYLILSLIFDIISPITKNSKIKTSPSKIIIEVQSLVIRNYFLVDGFNFLKKLSYIYYNNYYFTTFTGIAHLLNPHFY